MNQSVIESLKTGDWVEFQTKNGLKKGLFLGVEEGTAPDIPFFFRDNIRYAAEKEGQGIWILVPAKVYPILYSVAFKHLTRKVYNPASSFSGIYFSNRFRSYVFPKSTTNDFNKKSPAILKEEVVKI